MIITSWFVWPCKASTIAVSWGSGFGGVGVLSQQCDQVLLQFFINRPPLPRRILDFLGIADVADFNILLLDFNQTFVEVCHQILVNQFGLVFWQLLLQVGQFNELQGLFSELFDGLSSWELLRLLDGDDLLCLGLCQHHAFLHKIYFLDLAVVLLDFLVEEDQLTRTQLRNLFDLVWPQDPGGAHGMVKTTWHDLVIV